MASFISRQRTWEIFLLLVIVTAMVALSMVFTGGASAQPLPGEIQGTVTGADDGLPIQGATVQPYDSNGDPYGTAATSDINGDYALPNLEEGDYRLLFVANDGVHSFMFYLDQPSVDVATPITVPAGTLVPDIDQAIPTGNAGDIHGNVTAADTGLPIVGGEVQAYDLSGMPVGDAATTNSSGDYLLPGLSPANYKVLFKALDGIHAQIYYLDQPNFEGATPVTVPPGTPVYNIDQALPLGGSLAGTVYGADTSLPLENVEMHLYKVTYHNHVRTDTEIPYSPIVKTDAAGAYIFRGLESGQYIVQGIAKDYIHSESWWYNGKANQTDATPILVQLGAPTANIDLRMPAGGSIRGTVTDIPGDPIEGVNCMAYKYDPVSKAWVFQRAVETDAFGHYILGPVGAGQYKMQFAPPTTHLGEWYNDKPDLEHASTFTVNTSQSTLNINAELTTTASVSGKVFSEDADEYPISAVTVNAYRKVGSTWSLMYSKPTMSYRPPVAPDVKPGGGDFLIEGMVPGTYIFEFVPPRPFWTTEYYSNKPDKTTASQVILSDGEEMVGVDEGLKWNTNYVEWYGVTPAGASDFGSMLATAGFGYNPLQLDLQSGYDLLNLSLLKRFKWVFINCAGDFHDSYQDMVDWFWPGNPENSALSQYVNGGGKLLVSDHCVVPIMPDLGSPFTFVASNTDYEHAPKQNMTASVVDAAMQASIGTSSMPITYDKDGTSALSDVAPGTTINMRATVNTDLGSALTNAPICATYPFGSGKLVYQTFHLNKQSTEYAKKILYYFLERKPTPPKIDSISPASGPIGTTVTIKGSNFGSSQVSSSWVTFNTAKATSIVAWSSKEIRVRVPKGAKTGPVWVTTGAGTSNKLTFTVRDAPEGAVWYLAEGCSDFGFETYITIENPNGQQVTASVQYMTPSGPVTKPDFQLPAYSQTTINPRDDLGSKDFSTKVTCKEGQQIAVDRRMLWTGQGAPSQEGHTSVGVTAPAKKWYLAEGSTKWGFECWLLAQNPNSAATQLTVTYMIEGEGPVQKTKPLSGNSRLSWNMADDIGAKDASIMVESDSTQTPIIVERAMYRNDRREGHESVGTAAVSKTFYLAEGTTGYGFTTYVLVQNPNPSASTVTLTYMTGSGPKTQPSFSLPANSRKTIRVNDIADMQNQDFSTKVTGSQPIIAERAMYWGAGSPLGEACHDSMGMYAPHSRFYLPDGETSNGYETWTCVQNPNNSAVNIEVIYYLAGGTKQVQPIPDTIPANSRKTYNMADKVPNGKASILVRCVTPDMKIMAERSMYWNSRGAGANTIGGFSDDQ